MIESVSRNRWRYHKRLSKQFRTAGNNYKPNRAYESFCIMLRPTFKSTVMSELLVNAWGTSNTIPRVTFLHTFHSAHFPLLSCSTKQFLQFGFLIFGFLWRLDKDPKNKESSRAELKAVPDRIRKSYPNYWIKYWILDVRCAVCGVRTTYCELWTVNCNSPSTLFHKTAMSRHLSTRTFWLNFLSWTQFLILKWSQSTQG